MPELKVREAEFYRAIYCGVCRGIKLELGELPRFALRYEAALMALIWMSLEGKPFRMERRLCAAKPIQLHTVMADHPALRHAGRVCLVLAHAKAEDEMRDGRTFAGAILRALLSPAAQKARSAMKPETVDEIRRSCEALVELEKQNSDLSDAVADTSGRLLRAVFLDYPGIPEKSRETLSWMGYHLGRWLYLADALLDEQEDENSGQYNPILASDRPREEIRQLIRDSADFSAAQAAAAFDVLDWHIGQGILENVLYLGMPAAFKRRKNERSLDSTGRVTERQ